MAAAPIQPQLTTPNIINSAVVFWDLLLFNLDVGGESWQRVKVILNSVCRHGAFNQRESRESVLACDIMQVGSDWFRLIVDVRL